MNWETFYGKMDKSGRITIPKLTRNLLQSKTDNKNLTDIIMEKYMQNPHETT